MEKNAMHWTETRKLKIFVFVEQMDKLQFF